jgi:IPT/TIG domain
MLDTFILLTPILLLAVVALFGFVGCNQILGLKDVLLNVTVDSVNPGSGPTVGGQLVSITGSGFETGATATFDGIPATNVVVGSDGAIIDAQTPQRSSGFVDVTVTNPDGTSGTLSAGYHYAAVTHLLTVPASGNDGPLGLSRSSTMPAFPAPGKLIIITVEWGGAATMTLTGGSFVLLTSDNLQPQRVETYYANNISTTITVTATLSASSTTNFNLFLSAYDNADPNSVPDPQSPAQGTGTSLMLPFATNILGISADDLIYAVAVTRDSGFVLNGTLAAGTAPDPVFMAEGAATGFLIEDYVLTPADIPPAQSQIIVSATNTTGAATSKWFLVALRIRHL